MPLRHRAPWLSIVLGLALGILPFLGSADASPNASNVRSHPERVVRRRHHPPPSRARHGRSHARPSRDPAVEPDDPGLTREHILATSASESIGRAAQGRLRNGVQLGQGRNLDVLASSREANYGTSELVALIEHAATVVGERHPGAHLYVGDLSKHGGGHLSSHRSHRSGRDADIGFYFLDEEGQPVPARHFVRFDASGVGVTGWSADTVRFDAARNWTLLESMIRFEGAALQYVFVAPRLQPLLLEEAARQGADPAIIARATALMSHYAGGHDNHFHVRIHCPASDHQCIDNEARRRRRGGHHARRPVHRD